MASKNRYTMKQVIDAIRKARGLVSFAAKLLECDPDTVYNYARRYPKVQAAIEAERGRFVDVAEGKLMEAVQKGEPWAVALVVKTLGKLRGYSERSEQVSIDVSSLDDEQLQRIVNGEDPIRVVSSGKRRAGEAQA